MCPLVSVCVITCNHERYIRECLDSILSQQTDFAIEIIVGDDCSSDNTADIVREYGAAHPGVIRAILHCPKVGGTQNLFSVHNEAIGEFVAHIDGDDRMLPGKLQRQADFLRAHTDHSFVVHDVQIIDQHSRVIAGTFGAVSVPASFDIDYLAAHGCFFTHSSKMYRRSAARTLHRDRPTVDMYFHLEHARSGSIGYIDDILGQYRRAGTGLTSMHSAYRLDVLAGHLDAFEYAIASGVPAAIVNAARLNFRYVQAMASVRAGRFPEFQLLTKVPAGELSGATLRQRIVFRQPALMAYVASSLLDSVRWFGRRMLRRD
jgi:glycosyltransferase involved in cell wall biosynthesis